MKQTIRKRMMKMMSFIAVMAIIVTMGMLTGCSINDNPQGCVIRPIPVHFPRGLQGPNKA